MQNTINRDEYLKKLINRQENGLVKVISGTAIPMNCPNISGKNY